MRFKEPQPREVITFHELAAAEIEPHGYKVQKEAQLLMRYGYVMDGHAGSITWRSYLPHDLTVVSYQLLVERVQIVNG